MNLLKLIRTTQDVAKVAELVGSLAGKAVTNEDLRKSIGTLTGKVKNWRPRSRGTKLERKLAAITTYADDLHEQFPNSSAPQEWTMRARHLRSRAALAKNLPGKARRHEMADLRASVDDLLRQALTYTAELLSQPDQATPTTPEFTDDSPRA